MSTTQNNITEIDGVCDMLHNMSTADNENSISTCANCGKESDNLKACTACTLVKYCNRDCQIAHRPQHKKECRRRAAELHDIELFKQPPNPYGDCPICFLRIPSLSSGSIYHACCGKFICCGCYYAPVYDNQGNKVDIEKQNECAFCRVVAPKSNEKLVKRIMKRVELDDPMAIYNLGVYYRDGLYGFPQDHTKALELWYRAGELGSAESYGSIGYVYNNGQGMKVDKKKAKYYYELSAMRGNVAARHNIGNNEWRAGNFDRALKHFIIAVRGGSNSSLEMIKQMYTDGYSTKEDYTKALQLYQAYLGEIKSKQRDEAAAAYSVRYRYY